jgi:methylmalonyl-CoA mutase
MESVPKEFLSNIAASSNSKVLVRQRAGLQIEKIRLVTETFVSENGFRPTVEIASYGQLTMRKARAAFAYDFIGVSGYEIESEKSFESAIKAAQQTAGSKSDIVVICSSDPDYLNSALDFVKEFRSKNSSKTLMLAGYPEQIKDALIDAGLDGFIHVRSDIFKTLSDIQNKISKTTKPLEI